MDKGFWRLRKRALTILCCAALACANVSPLLVYADTEETEIVTEADAEPEESDTESKKEADSEPKKEADSEVETEEETEVKLETETDEETKVKDETKADGETEGREESETKDDTGVKEKSETKEGTEVKEESETKEEAEVKEESETKEETDPQENEQVQEENAESEEFEELVESENDATTEESSSTVRRARVSRVAARAAATTQAQGTLRGYYYVFRLYDDNTAKILSISKTKSSSDTLTVVSGFKKDGQSYTITAIDSNVVLPNNVVSVTFPDNLDISVADSLFLMHTNLEEVTLPAGTSTIPASWFSNCTALRSVKANGTITSIGKYAFSTSVSTATNAGYCTKLTEIPDLSHVSSLGEYAFYGCDNLNTAVDLSSLTEIPNYAFYSTKVTVSEFSDDLTSVGNYAFRAVTNGDITIETAQFPDSLKTIGYGAFRGCKFPETFTIPDSVNSINTNAFTDALGVKNLYVGTKRTGLSELDSKAFVSDLEKVTIASSAAEFSYENENESTEVIYLYNDDDNDKISDEEDALTLQEAVNKVAAGELNGPIILKKNVRLTSTLYVPAGEEVVIQSADNMTYSVSGLVNYEVDNLVVVKDKAALTLKNVNLSGKYGDNNVVTNSIIKSSGTVTLDGAKVSDGKLSRSGCGIIDISGSNAVLNIKDGSVIRDNEACSNSATIRVSEGQINITGGTIRDNTTSALNDTEGTGGVLLVNGAVGTMSGGEIINNRGCRGAAIHLYGAQSDHRVAFTLSGGTIKDNMSYSKDDLDSGRVDISSNVKGAGAVYVEGYADLTMKGGTINNNWSRNVGGGVTVTDPGVENGTSEQGTSFTMNGGSITNNKANTGAGIYSFSNSVSLNKGTISGNKADSMGGGVYSEGNLKGYGTIRMNTVSIRDNRALTTNGQGGGMWFCPTGTGTIHITDGAVIHDNKSWGAGDDLVTNMVSNYDSAVCLEERTLGGGKVTWQTDGGIETAQSLTTIASVDHSVERTPHETVDVSRINKSLALKTSISEADIAAADKEAGLVIENNEATLGGGVAANGGVSIGKPNPVNIRVVKAWTLDDGRTQPESVTIQLYRDGKAYGETVVLNQSNDWSYKWESLEGGYDWTVEEVDVPEGFAVTVSGPEIQVADGITTKTYKVTNDDKPFLTSIKVVKKWILDDGGTKPASVQVRLTQDGKAYGEAVTLNEENGWTYTWKDLEQKHTWSIEEINFPTGFTSKLERTDADDLITFTITNDDEKPDKPNTPGGGDDDDDDDGGGGDNPPTPTPPTPSTPPTEDTPGEEQPPTEETPVESSEKGERVEGNTNWGYYDEYGNWHYYDEAGFIAQTGDDSLMSVYAGLAGLSVVVLAGWSIMNSRKRSR